MARWRLAVPVLLLLAVVTTVQAEDPPFVGKPAPDFELTGLDGGRVSLSDLRDKIVVLHFGTGW